jgi:uncharacterized membrane protein YqgA involved in biofilm formation
MLGPLVNALVVVVCALAGCFLVRGIPERFEEILRKSLGLAIIYLGIKGTMDNQRVLLLIISMVIGALAGELIDIHGLMNRFGDWAERKLRMGESLHGSLRGNPQRGKSGFSKGFVSASILFCTGSMAIVGSMQSGLAGNHEILYAKSILDGSISIVFGASMGIGVAFAALPVLIYQGAIALASMAVKDLLTPEIIREMSAVGSLLVAGIGFNFLGLREIRVANLIPAIFIPWIYLVLERAIGA